MTTKHTPGPYQLEKIAGDYAISKGQFIIGYVPTHANNALANARLLATSSELLQSVKDLLIVINQHVADDENLIECECIEKIKQARAAIQKAGG